MVYIGQKSFRLYRDMQDKNIDEPLFECDELLAPTIQLLNMLGYKTTSCCSGHLVDGEYDTNILTDHKEKSYNCDCYIQFENSINELRRMGFIPINEAIIPMDNDDGFVMQEFVFRNRENGAAELRRVLNHENGRLFEMIDSAAVLIKWASRLHPARKENL